MQMGPCSDVHMLFFFFTRSVIFDSTIEVVVLLFADLY